MPTRVPKPEIDFIDETELNPEIQFQNPISPNALSPRAICLTDYCVADGTTDDAFVHATLKIGAGRDPSVKKKACDELFAMIKDHFADLYAGRSPALSMELYEFDEGGTYQHNNIHARYRKS